MKTLKSASNKSALASGLPAKKILNASLPSMIVKRNAERKLPAGVYASPAKAARRLSMWPNALKLRDAIRPHSKRS